jgi:PAS domain-containing protein
VTSHDPFSDSEYQRPEPFRADFSEGLETGLYLALLELIDEGLVITGDETIIEVNSSACRLLERDYRALAGQPLATLFPSEKAFFDARAKLFIQGQMRGSLQVSLPGARRRNLRFVAAARIRPGIHALILSPDIIAEAYAEQTAGDAVWPKLGAAMAQGLIVIDSEERITAANAGAQRRLALSSDQLVGRAIDTLFRIEYETSGRTPRVSLLSVANQETLRGRMLDGPRPGWRLLVLDPPDPSAATPLSGEDPSDKLFAASPLPTVLCSADDHRILGANAAATTAFGHSLHALKRLTIAALRADGERSVSPSGNWRFRQHDGRIFECHVITWPVGDPARPDAFVVTLAWSAEASRIVQRGQQAP